MRKEKVNCFLNYCLVGSWKIDLSQRRRAIFGVQRLW